jgi:hypothetical protein
MAVPPSGLPLSPGLGPPYGCCHVGIVLERSILRAIPKAGHGLARIVRSSRLPIKLWRGSATFRCSLYTSCGRPAARASTTTRPNDTSQLGTVQVSRPAVTRGGLGRQVSSCCSLPT